MGFELRRFPEHNLALRIVSGTVTVEDVIRFYEGLDPSHGPRWLTYIDPETAAHGDFIPVARIPEIRRVLATKMEELFGDRPLVSTIVCDSAALRDIINFWRAYGDAGEAHPVHAALFPTLEAAYDWMNLPEAARAEVTGAVEHHVQAEKRRSAEAGALQGAHAYTGTP